MHIDAKRDQIAEAVLLPGDPLRAKWIAEEFLDEVVQFNRTRNMLGFTGYWQGNRVSVMGSGMGQSSLSIYVNELFMFYDVERIIRTGTCGGLKKVNLRDIVIPMTASTDSNMNSRTTNGLDFSPCASYDLLEKAVQTARDMGVNFHVGKVGSMDFYYHTTDAVHQLEELGTLAVEMETNALYTLAAKYNKQALSVLTVSDILRDLSTETSSEERERGFPDMVNIALHTLFS